MADATIDHTLARRARYVAQRGPEVESALSPMQLLSVVQRTRLQKHGSRPRGPFVQKLGLVYKDLNGHFFFEKTDQQCLSGAANSS